MNRLTLLILSGLGVSSGGLAQQLSPSVMATAGGVARSQTMTLEWTLGESVVETHQATDRLYTQGFHQPTLHVTEQLVGSDAGYEFMVAPNPVSSHLTVTAKHVREVPLQLQLTDMTGRQFALPYLPATAESMQVDMARFPAGTYLLHIGTDAGPTLKTYKVVKDQ